MTIIFKMNKGQRADKLQNLKIKARSTGEFTIVAKFGDHVLHHLASSLSSVIRQASRQKFQFR